METESDEPLLLLTPQGTGPSQGSSRNYVDEEFKSWFINKTISLKFFFFLI